MIGKSLSTYNLLIIYRHIVFGFMQLDDILHFKNDIENVDNFDIKS